MTRSTFGPAYDEKRDGARLDTQRLRLRDYMLSRHGPPLTLGEIAAALSRLFPDARWPEGSISAQLRHLKKPHFGAYRLEKEYAGFGLFRYTLLPPLPRVAPLLPVREQQALFENSTGRHGA